MIPNVAKRGTSFRGAGLYYLHDKRESHEKQRLSTERIPWTAVRNLSSNDPEFALRVMAATAMDKDRLKEDAGVKKGGRKSTKGDVYAYSLSWHPDEAETLTKEEMLSAADQTIQALGVEDHQALIIAHDDEPHPHVHIVVNMVNPKNGKNFSTSNDFRKLESWAYQYRKGRGEETKYCPKRHKKMKAIEAKKKGEKVPFVRGDKMIPRKLHQDVERVGVDVKSKRVKELVKKEASENAQLVKDSEQLIIDLEKEKESLSGAYAQQRKDIKLEFRAEKTAAGKRIKAQYEEIFEKLERRQKSEKEFEREGVLSAFEAVGIIKSLGRVFNFFSADKYKRSELIKKHDRELKDLQMERNAEVDETVVKLEENYKKREELARDTFKTQRQSLLKKEDLAKKDLQARWRARQVRKDNAISALAIENRVIVMDKEYLSKEFKASNDESFNKDRKVA